MRAFNATTEQLENTHVTLQKEVSRLKSELAEANAQLRRSRDLAALGEMAAGIAHEIRNSLGPIRLEVQMLAEDVAPGGHRDVRPHRSRRREHRIDRPRHAALRPGHDDRAGGRPGALELAHAGVLTCEALMSAADIDLRLEVPEDPACAIEADAGLLTQAVGNVVRNAADALTEAGTSPRRITVSATRRAVRCPSGRTAPRVVLAVEDTGPGVPEDVVERMFNPFFTTRATGTGLGLAIVHRIVGRARWPRPGHQRRATRRAGGAVPPRDAGGRGCGLATDPPSTDPPPTDPDGTLSSKGWTMTKVLIVDDKELMRDSVATTLARKGHVVATAPGGQAAVRKIAERQFDAVITDLQMPEMDGSSCSRRSAASTSSFPSSS